MERWASSRCFTRTRIAHSILWRIKRYWGDRRCSWIQVFVYEVIFAIQCVFSLFFLWFRNISTEFGEFDATERSSHIDRFGEVFWFFRLFRVIHYLTNKFRGVCSIYFCNIASFILNTSIIGFYSRSIFIKSHGEPFLIKAISRTGFLIDFCEVECCLDLWYIQVFVCFL